MSWAGGTRAKVSNLCPPLSKVALFALGLRCHAASAMLQTAHVKSRKPPRDLRADRTHPHHITRALALCHNTIIQILTGYYKNGPEGVFYRGIKESPIAEQKRKPIQGRREG